MDLSQYEPAPAVSERLRQVDFIAVVGPSAAGKDAIMAAAREVNPNLRRVLSTVSRRPRPGEQPDVDYYFRSKEEMLERAQRGEYVQITSTPLGDLYATHADDYPTTGMGMMAVLAHALPTFAQLPFKRFRSAYILPPSWEAWQERLDNHNFTPNQRTGRLVEASGSLQFALTHPDTYFIVNDELTTAARAFTAFSESNANGRADGAAAIARTVLRQVRAELSAT